MPVEETDFYRSRATRGLAVTMTAVAALVLLSGVGGVGQTGASAALEAGGIVLIAVALLAIIWIWVFFAQMGVATTDAGIVVRNWIRKSAIPWSEIRSFEFGEHVECLTLREQLASPVLQTYVVLKDGRHQVMCGLSATRLRRAQSKHRVQELLDSLEEARTRRAP